MRRIRDLKGRGFQPRRRCREIDSGFTGCWKSSASNRFWEGHDWEEHDFSRAVKSSRIGRALAPEVGFPLPKRVFQPACLAAEVKWGEGGSSADC